MATMPASAWAAARTAADRLVGRRADPSVVRAVLAQWIAENGWRWPPPRNNPGNVARGWAANFDIPFYWTLPNPQPSNPIVTFRRLDDGVRCYTAGLLAFARYALAVRAARAGQGLQATVLICRAGYGTRESTVRMVYAALGGEPAPAPAPAPGGHDVAIRYAQVAGTRTRMRLREGQALYQYPGGPRITVMQATGSVPHIGLAGSVAGKAWRAVLIGTRGTYDDGRVRPTILYVPASAGEVVPT
jgi:hypothetical protein